MSKRLDLSIEGMEKEACELRKHLYRLGGRSEIGLLNGILSLIDIIVDYVGFISERPTGSTGDWKFLYETVAAIMCQDSQSIIMHFPNCRHPTTNKSVTEMWRINQIGEPILESKLSGPDIVTRFIGQSVYRVQAKDDRLWMLVGSALGTSFVHAKKISREAGYAVTNSIGIANASVNDFVFERTTDRIDRTYTVSDWRVARLSDGAPNCIMPATSIKHFTGLTLCPSSRIAFWQDRILVTAKGEQSTGGIIILRRDYLSVAGFVPLPFVPQALATFKESVFVARPWVFNREEHSILLEVEALSTFRWLKTPHIPGLLNDYRVTQVYRYQRMPFDRDAAYDDTASIVSMIAPSKSLFVSISIGGSERTIYFQ
jgi:hypothetical protein